MKKIPVIIDCDTGFDDAIALMVACANEKLDIRAITTVCGNQTLEKTTTNTLKVLDLLDKKIPLAAGCAAPIVKAPHPATHAHGESGLGDVELPDPKENPCDINAVQMMEKVVSESDEKITIIAIGPLTNVAVFLLANEALHSKIERIVIMGGATNGGNITPCAEFNIWHDPQAASIVFSSDVPVVMFGLDVTEKGYITDSEVQEIRKLSPVGDIFGRLMDFYGEYVKKIGRPLLMHDANVIAYLLDESIYDIESYYVEVDCSKGLTEGATVTDMRPENFRAHAANTEVAMNLNREKFIDIVKNAIASYA